MSALRLSCALVLFAVSGCRCLLVDVPEFGLECQVRQGDNGPPLQNDAEDGCSDPPDPNEETYLCRSSGPSLEDAAFCVPRACEARGTMYVVNPSQLMQLDQVLGENPGEACFEGVHIARTAGVGGGRIVLEELALVAGDLVIDMVVAPGGEGAEPWGLRSISLPALTHVRDRMAIVAVDDIDPLRQPVMTIAGEHLETFSAPALLDVATPLPDDPGGDVAPVGNGLRILITGPRLADVDLRGLERVQSMTIADAPALESLQLTRLEVTQELVVRDSGSLGGDDFFFDGEEPRLAFTGDSGTLQVTDTTVDSCAPVRLVVALVDRGWNGLVYLENNQLDAGDTDCFVEEAVLQRASELCATFEDFPDEPDLRCDL